MCIRDSFPTKLGPAMKEITAGEGTKALWKGIVPLWCRQIPYTMVKFATFENIVGLFYKYCFTKPRESYSKAMQLTITFASGYIAGMFCALVSHPFDSCVSKMNNSAEKISMMQAMKILGWKGCWNGLATRILMIGTLTGLQLSLIHILNELNKNAIDRKTPRSTNILGYLTLGAISNIKLNL